MLKLFSLFMEDSGCLRIRGKFQNLTHIYVELAATLFGIQNRIFWSIFVGIGKCGSSCLSSPSSVLFIDNILKGTSTSLL